MAQVDIDRFYDMAFDKAWKKLLALQDGGYIPLSKANMRKVAKETQNQVRNETMAQLGGEINTIFNDFETDLAGRMDEWGSSAAMAAGADAVFPDNCKFATCKDGSSTFIIQHQPQVRTCIGNDGGFGGREGVNRYQLAFPYTIFGIHFMGGNYANCTIAVSNKPLTSLDDEVKQMYISNIYKAPDNLGICMYPETIKGTLNEQCQQVIGHFWQSPFHGGSVHNYTKCPDPRMSSWKEWQKNTLEDPNFILEVDWPKVNKEAGAKKGKYTVKTLIERIRNAGAISGYRDRGNRDGGAPKGKNYFRRDGQQLLQKIQKAIITAIAPDDYEIEQDPDFVPEFEIKELPPEEKPIPRDNFAALNMAKEAARRKKAEVEGVVFADKPGRGQKACPDCQQVVGARLQLCNCGYDFRVGRNPNENIAAAAAHPALAPARVVMPAPRRKPARRPEPVKRKIPAAVEAKIKNLVEQGAELARNKKAAGQKVGRGKKECPKCQDIVGARARHCGCGFQFF